MICPETGYVYPDSSIYCLVCGALHPKKIETGINQPEEKSEKPRRKPPTRSRNKDGRWRKKRSDTGKKRGKKK